jgi:transposase
LTGSLFSVASVSISEDATVPDSSPHPRSDAATRRWVERLERFAAGNHTVAAFCTAEGVSQANFYLWRRRLAQPVPSPLVCAPTVVPLRVAPSPATPIELALPSGTVVRFSADTRPELLVAVLRGLEERPC